MISDVPYEPCLVDPVFFDWILHTIIVVTIGFLHLISFKLVLLLCTSSKCFMTVPSNVYPQL